MHQSSHGPASEAVGLGRHLARIVGKAVEISLVLLAIVLLLALGRQMLTLSYRVMGHDTDYYLAVGRQVAAGLVPYRDFSFEYPPLALAPVVLPVALASALGLASRLDGTTYVVLLALENAVTVAITAVCLVWLARRGWSARSPLATVGAFVLLIVATPILFWRFDALPTLLTVIALCALAAKRPTWAGFALGAGAATKLYPLALLPIFVLRPVLTRSWRDVGAILSGALLPLVAGVALLVGGSGAGSLGFLRYQSARGVQLESVPSSIALVVHLISGMPVAAFQGFGAWQLESQLLDQLGWLWPIVSLAMIVLVGIAATASYRADLSLVGRVEQGTQVAMVTATIVVTLLAYRVLSPQYVVWLLPFAALLPRGKLMLTLAISTLTLYIFPFAYEGLVHLSIGSIAALALRNGLLLALFVWLVGPGLMLALRGVVGRGRSRRTSALAST